MTLKVTCKGPRAGYFVLIFVTPKPSHSLTGLDEVMTKPALPASST